MCSNFYPTLDPQRLTVFALGLQQDWVSPFDTIHVFNHQLAPMILPSPDGVDEPNQLMVAEFGLLPSWSKERHIKYATMNARYESVATKPAFKNAWFKGQKCIVPADAIVEPDWRTGKHIPAHISRLDDKPMGIAGLWDYWTDALTGEVVFSFTMLTINADEHEFMQRFHKPQDEKRMVVILEEADYQKWLKSPVEDNHKYIKPYPAEGLLLQEQIQPMNGSLFDF